MKTQTQKKKKKKEEKGKECRFLKFQKAMEKKQHDFSS